MNLKNILSTKKRAILAAGGAAVLCGTAITAAAFTDFASLNLGNGAGGGIGSTSTFDIAVVEEGKVRQADTQDGLDWKIGGSDALVPGGSITTTIPVFNNSPKVKSALDLAVELQGDEGAVAGKPNITKFLRFTATVDGTALFENATWDEAKGAIAEIAPRGADPLAEGDDYVAGEQGSAIDVEFRIDYLDEPETVDFNGGQSAIGLKLTGTSVS